jgi:hypothetical protein
VEAPIDPLAIPARFFKMLTKETGGRTEEVAPFTLVRNDSKGWEYRAQLAVDLAAPFLRAVDDFRASYVLRYVPEGVSSTGWHDIVVRVPKGAGRYEVTSRKGYDR